MKYFTLSAKTLATMFLTTSIFVSCTDTDIYKGDDDDDNNSEEFFDFALKSDVTLGIDYGLAEFVSDGNYQVIFYLFTEMPYEYDEAGNASLKEGISPIYSSWTDNKGKFNKEINLPTSLKKVYLVSQFIGTVKVVELDVVDGKINFNQKEYLSKTTTKVATKNQSSYSIPDGWKTLGDWDSNGKPDYLVENMKFPTEFLNKMFDMFKSGDDYVGAKASELIYNKYPEFFSETGKNDMDLHIIKDTKVTLSLIKCDASYKSAVGYYVYKTDERPSSAAEIGTVIVAFPHVSSTASVSTGSQIELKFLNEEKELTDTFPAGYSIGFVLANNGFDGKGNIGASGLIYSDYNFNSSNNSVKGRRSVALYDNDTEQLVVIGFEDYPEYDVDFDDAVLNVWTSEKQALSTEKLPELEPKDPEPVEPNYTVEGTLLFEDLWPSKGDYDMNDVVVTYSSTVTLDKNNDVSKTVDVLTPIHNGATFKNSFGYQFGSHVAPSDIASISINSDSPVSAYMQGQKSEPGQAKQTIILFDNMTPDMIGVPYTITTEFKDGAVSEVNPPYNPFIVIHDNDNAGRGRELHLINKIPTDLVDSSLFGTGDDKSKPGEGYYYLSDEDFPFSLDIPMLDFRIPKEKMVIDQAYPNYSGWVRSQGVQYTNWYTNPNTSNVY